MRIAVLVLVALAAAGAHAQDSQEWFNKAVYSTNPDEQIHYYNKSLEVDPHNYQAMHNLASVYYRKGHVRKAIGAYESLIRNGHAYYQTFYNLACCYARVGDNQHALKALKRAFQKGFKDDKLIARDEDLTEVRADPEYARMAAVYLKGAKGARRRGPSPALREEIEGLDAEVAASPKPKKAKKAKSRKPSALDEGSITAKADPAEPVPAESARPPRPIGRAQASAEVLGATAVGK
jgi:tetratricopeptide (TPR) repeat protein